MRSTPYSLASAPALLRRAGWLEPYRKAGRRKAPSRFTIDPPSLGARDRAMSKTYTIRPFRAADRPQWQRLWAGYLAFYETDVAAEVSDTTWRRLLDPEAAIMGFCAARGDGGLLGIEGSGQVGGD